MRKLRSAHPDRRGIDARRMRPPSVKQAQDPRARRLAAHRLADLDQERPPERGHVVDTVRQRPQQRDRQAQSQTERRARREADERIRHGRHQGRARRRREAHPRARRPARLERSARGGAAKARRRRLSMHDSTLVAQVAEYEKTIADLRHTVDQQKADYEATIAKQTAQIAALNSKVDTVTHREHAARRRNQDADRHRHAAHDREEHGVLRDRHKGRTGQDRASSSRKATSVSSCSAGASLSPGARARPGEVHAHRSRRRTR